MQNNTEEHIATLVHPDEYSHHLNQVAGLSTKNIVFLKRKFLSKAGSELVKLPVSDCAQVYHKDERPLVTIVFGALLVAIVAYLLYALFIYWNSLEPGTRIPIGLLGLAGVYGLRWVFGARRHKIVFVMRDGSKLIWKSSSGDYKYKSASANNVIEFAKSAGLLRTAQ
jgi:hypothetical protein